MSHERQPTGYSLDEVFRLAQETLLRQGSHAPTLVVLGDRGGLAAVIPELPDTHSGRCQSLKAAGLALAQTGKLGKLEQITFICEGWMSVYGNEGRTSLPPSQDPDRVEVLIIDSLRSASRELELAIFEMQRDSAGQLMGLRPLETLASSAGVHADSPLLDAFVQGFESGRRSTLN
jgi:hypothetical protein